MDMFSAVLISIMDFKKINPIYLFIIIIISSSSSNVNAFQLAFILFFILISKHSVSLGVLGYFTCVRL